MSTITLEASSMSDPHTVISLTDDSGGNIVLRSKDSYRFQVPRSYIVNSSPVLFKRIQNAPVFPNNTNADGFMPVVELPESGEILRYLLTFVFPKLPCMPSTLEEIMELLHVAQKYQMEAALAHIRASVAQHNLLPIHLEPARHCYALAQKHGLRQEALQAARIISKYPMTIEDFGDKLDIISGASLYELRKYYERVRAVVASDIANFRVSVIQNTVTDYQRTGTDSSKFLCWLGHNVESMAMQITPHHFDFSELNIAMTDHIMDRVRNQCCVCGSVPSKIIRQFWEDLMAVVHGSFKKAESALLLVREREGSQAQINPTKPQPDTFNASSRPDPDLILRSSDLVNFRVHMAVLNLASESASFEGLLSQPQSFSSETVDKLPVIQLSEDSALLNCLFSMLYQPREIPSPSLGPSSYDKVLHLLAACQKYELDSIMSLVRAKVKSGEFPAPKGTEAFAAYAIASSKRLFPEMEMAARLTLDHPMTFETIGEGLRLFEDSALHNLANFRMRCKNNIVTCLDSFSRPSDIWRACTDTYTIKVDQSSKEMAQNFSLPTWLILLLEQCKELKFTDALDMHSRIGEMFYAAPQAHASSCIFCTSVMKDKNSKFCADLEDKLARAQEKVTYSPLFFKYYKIHR